ncbi:MAG TPA: DUF2336 domain-containing protein [Ferrovibrio sp.]|uniref:DUF2336 domain-containing protein n=1 Tax=Ferrovibrio sp. TaxID=1917215 RepID=UPI002ED23111
MSSTAFLSIRDVERLLADPSPAARADTAVKVSQAYGGRSLTAAERELALAIITALSRDAELRVREALAEHIKDNPALPRPIALRLVRDVAAVAAPVLQHSPVFSDADLIELLQSVSPRHQVAIAGRRQVSAAVAAVLVDRGAEPAVAALLSNRGAAVSPAMMGRALDRFSDSRAVGEALARHPNLPPKFAARLIAQISEAMRETLIARYQIPPAMAGEMMLQLRERALLGLLGEGAAPPRLADLVADLQRRGQLGPTMILRALAGGDLAFFEQALAQLCRIPLRNAQMLIHDPGRRGLAAIYQRCGLPGEYLPMAEAIVEMARGFKLGVSAADRAFFVEAVTQRVLTDFAMLWDAQDRRWFERRRSRAQAAQRIAA